MPWDVGMGNKYQRSLVLFGIKYYYISVWVWSPPSYLGFPSGSAVKNPPAMKESQFESLGWEDPLEEGMATHSSTLAWRVPWTVEPGGLLSKGSHRVGQDMTAATAAT